MKGVSGVRGGRVEDGGGNGCVRTGKLKGQEVKGRPGAATYAP